MKSQLFHFDVDYLPAEHVVLITTVGHFDFASNQKIVNAGLEAWQRHGTHLFLIDHRRAEIAMRPGDIPVASKVNFMLGLRPLFRRAFLHDPACPSHALIEQYVALNNSLGLTSKTFVGPSEAMEWLVAEQAAGHN